MSAKGRGRGIGAETKGSAWPFVALALPILWSMTPPLSTPFLDIITIPISIYRGGDGDDRFCGVATFDKSGKGATSILQIVVWVSSDCPIKKRQTGSFLCFLRFLRSCVGRLHVHSVLRLW